jgi:acetylornithine deacetylase/succinyl-diaminopimelate desuccinylase-like protein
VSAGGVTGSTNAHLDEEYALDILRKLARVPTDVPLGFDTLIEPDDPKLVHYVQRVVREELVAIGAYRLIDVPRNNLVVELGSGRGQRVLLIQNYTPNQHFNLMGELEDPFSGKIGMATAYGVPDVAVFGQGVSENKVHQAAMLAVLKMLIESEHEIAGTLYWAVNNEGRSSHACSEAIVHALPKKPTFCVLQLAVGQNVISVGNRGRVDVDIHVAGTATHSSKPDQGLSAIEGAFRVMERLKELELGEADPHLGPRQAEVYKLMFDPVAPHTLPSDAYLTVDRRLLPGDDPAAATQEIRQQLSGMEPFKVEVSQGVHMLPAMVNADDPGVVALSAAHQTVSGTAAAMSYFQATFDAGGPLEMGIPTVMYGGGGGVWPVGVDFVPISELTREATVLSEFVTQYLG